MRPQVIFATAGGIFAILVARSQGADNLEALGAMIAGMISGWAIHRFLIRSST